MFYIDLMETITKRLKELSIINFAKFNNMLTCEYTKEYAEQQNLIGQFRELQNYEKSIDPWYCHDKLEISFRIQNILV